MSTLSKYMNMNNENPHKLPSRDSRELNVVERINKEQSMKEALPHVDDETLERKDVLQIVKENEAPVVSETDYTVRVTESTPAGYAKAYTISQPTTGLNVTINIPKDMVVESGEVVENPVGLAEGTYLKLVLANATEDEIFIPVSSLVNKTISKGDLPSEVQISLDKADTALQPANAPGYNDILTKTNAANTYVAKSGTNRLMTAAEGTKLSGIQAGATKVEKSTTNGNVLINGVESPVYVHPATHQIAEVEGLRVALDEKLVAADIVNKLEAKDIIDKADKATTLAGYSITDAYTKEESYSKAEVYAKTETYSKEEVGALIDALRGEITALREELEATPAT